MVKLLRHAVTEVNAEYYLFMEDDLTPCANALTVLKYLVDKVRSPLSLSLSPPRAAYPPHPLPCLCPDLHVLFSPLPFPSSPPAGQRVVA